MCEAGCVWGAWVQQMGGGTCKLAAEKGDRARREVTVEGLGVVWQYEA